MEIKWILSLALTVCISSSQCQTILPDSTNSREIYKLNFQSLSIPFVLIGYGTLGFKNEGIIELNYELKEEVDENITQHSKIDDYSRFIPAASVYALNGFGIKSKHNLRDKTILMVSSSLVMGTIVFNLKSLTKVTRPDGSASNSFPSGHTAMAFVGAEMLMQEYKHHSPWFGITGYLIASGTGFLRIYNDRHWLTDVVAGAGIGILSTRLMYWLYSNPFGTVHAKRKDQNSYVLPYINRGFTGISIQFDLN